MRLYAGSWFRVGAAGFFGSRRSPVPGLGGVLRGFMADTLSTATGPTAPLEQNGSASGPPEESESASAGAQPGRARRKKKRGAGERPVPPPKKRRAGVSFGDGHFAETSYYVEGGLRKVRPYFFDFQTYCKGRWVGRSLRHVFGAEFRAQPLAYYEAALRAGRLRLNGEPVRDLGVVLKVDGRDLARQWVRVLRFALR